MPGPYSTLYADPPWDYRDQGSRFGSRRHYPTMPYIAFAEFLRNNEVAVAENALCFLWATKDFHQDARCLLDDWGFKYRTEWIWVKGRVGNLNCSGDERGYQLKFSPYKLQIGGGHYNRLCHEYLLLGTRGNAKPLNAKREPSVIIAPRSAHSKKPEAARQMVERNSEAPRLELFASERVPGWDTWTLEGWRAADAS